MRPFGSAVFQSPDGDTLEWRSRIPTLEGELGFCPAGTEVVFTVLVPTHGLNPVAEHLSFLDPLDERERIVERRAEDALTVDGVPYERVGDFPRGD
jgi:hypothetical protein